MVLKFVEFITEAKSKDKNALVELLLKLLQDKPLVKLTGGNFPDEKDAYSLAGVKKYFKDNGFTAQDADDAYYYLNQDKEKKSKVKTLRAKNLFYNEVYPYDYMDLTSNEVSVVKNRIENLSKESSKSEIEKRSLTKKKSLVDRKDKKSKTSKETKTKK